MNLIDTPNLPTKRVKKLLISGEYEDLIKEINSLKIKTITTSACESLPVGEQYHADMQAIHIEDKIIVLKECTNLLDKLNKYNVMYSKTNVDIKSKYPYNVLLNCVILKDYVILNSKTVYSEILEICEKINKTVVDVNQGYTKCSTAIINDNAIITADSSIYKACKNHKIDVLKIAPGYISLPKFNYGFIGGCCGLIDKNTLIFTGNIKTHPDYNNIFAFCKNYNVDFISLTNKNLLDVGGIIPLSYG